MRSMKKVFASIVAASVVSGSAMAQAPEHPAGPAHQVEEAAHGDVAPDHGAGGDHGAAHSFTADDDSDGSANWSDSDSDLFVLDDLGFHAFNVSLLLAVLYALTRRPIGDTLKERALGIRNELTESAKTRDDAQRRYTEIDARLAAL